jgi:2-polyprenyl-6-methoxyphenol hydroxylase-like FAD-dependent oxidoreductase
MASRQASKRWEMARQTIATRVLIIGAGPVGLTLATDLAWRGIDVVVVERRHAGDAPEPKCNHISARSMEIFRRLGIATKLRNVGLPEDYPNDVSYRTSFTGIEFARISIPCRRDRFTDKSGPDGHWPTPEPPHRANQIFLEPALFEHAGSLPRVTILNRSQIESFEQSDEEVVATVRNLDTGETTRIACCYLVGCDGGRSTVRRAMGVQLEGDAVIQRVQATFIRAPDLIRLQNHERSWMTNAVNPRCVGNVIAIDGRERWMIFHYLKPDQVDFDAVDRDWGIRTILGVGPEFRYEILSNEDWYGRRLIASKFRQRRVFIAGDAAHIWVPYAGYGMNAGIADATNLSWLLAAHLNGWSPASILDAYEAERWPITAQVSRFAMAHAEREIKRRGAVPAAIEAPGPEGDRARAETGHLSYDINVHQYCCGGLNFGTYYAASPIIAYDGMAQPPFTMSQFTPSTVPGCRTPHVWLANGRSLYDVLGPDYTLLRLDPAVEVSPLVAAASMRRVPLTIVDVDSPEADRLYTQKLVLSRPDQHVAWRGEACPKDSLALIDLVRGAGPR